MVIYSDWGLMISSINNPTKSSESVSVHCEINKIVRVDLDEKLIYNTITFWFFSFLCATSGFSNSTVSAFIHFKSQPTFFSPLIWTVESLYIQGNKTEIWVRLTILRVNFHLFLWTENQMWGNIWVICSTSPQP